MTQNIGIRTAKKLAYYALVLFGLGWLASFALSVCLTAASTLLNLLGLLIMAVVIGGSVAFLVREVKLIIRWLDGVDNDNEQTNNETQNNE